MHERAARLPQVDVGLVAQQVERPVCAAVVDDQEGRYAESPAFREEPGKPWGLVADDETAEHFARIDVYRPLVHAAKAMSRERSIMTVQSFKAAIRTLWSRPVPESCEAHARTRRLRPPSAARCRELSRAGRVLPPHRRRVRRRGGVPQRPVHEALPEPAPTEAELGHCLAGIRRLDPVTLRQRCRRLGRGHEATDARLGHGRLVEALI